MAGTSIVEEGIANGSTDLDWMIDEVTMRRLATTDDIARVVIFLARVDAGSVMGQTIVVDRGRLILGMHDRPDWLRVDAPRSIHVL